MLAYPKVPALHLVESTKDSLLKDSYFAHK